MQSGLQCMHQLMLQPMCSMTHIGTGWNVTVPEFMMQKVTTLENICQSCVIRETSAAPQQCSGSLRHSTLRLAHANIALNTYHNLRHMLIPRRLQGIRANNVTLTCRSQSSRLHVPWLHWCSPGVPDYTGGSQQSNCGEHPCMAPDNRRDKQGVVGGDLLSCWHFFSIQ